MFRNLLIVLGPILGMILLLTLMLPYSGGDDDDGGRPTVSVEFGDGEDFEVPAPPEAPEPPEPPPGPDSMTQEIEGAAQEIKSAAQEIREEIARELKHELQQEFGPEHEQHDGGEDDGSSWRAALDTGNVILIAGSSQTAKRICKGDTKVAVLGNSNEVTLAGDCQGVVVTGNSNRVTVDVSRKLAVIGNSNAVSVGRVGPVYFRGNSNSVRYREALEADTPQLDEQGRGNRLKREE